MHTCVSGIEKLDEPVGGQIALFFMSRPAEAVLNTLPRANALPDAINKGIVPGPRMFVAEAQISVAGGDFDASSWDVRSDVEKFVTNRGNCFGVVECI